MITGHQLQHDISSIFIQVTDAQMYSCVIHGRWGQLKLAVIAILLD